MASSDVGYCKPRPVFVIVERIVGVDGLPSLLNLIGPKLRKVQRWVAQVCDMEEAYYRGQKMKDTPTLFQYLDEFLNPGKAITTQPTGKKELLLVYCGFRNLLTPLPTMGDLLPKAVNAEYDMTLPINPFTYGTDPIPDQQLFGNKTIDFNMIGGQGDPTAVATYDLKSKTLRAPATSERQAAIDKLLKSLNP